jgi:hypothetical protein
MRIHLGYEIEFKETSASLNKAAPQPVQKVSVPTPE